MKNIVLRTLATAGVMSVALIAPNALTLIKKLDRASARRKTLYNNIRLALWRLERNGLIVSTGEVGRRSVQLTKKGQVAIDSLFASEYQIPEPAFWDGRWHGRTSIFCCRST